MSNSTVHILSFPEIVFRFHRPQLETHRRARLLFAGSHKLIFQSPHVAWMKCKWHFDCSHSAKKVDNFSSWTFFSVLILINWTGKINTTVFPHAGRLVWTHLKTHFECKSIPISSVLFLNLRTSISRLRKYLAHQEEDKEFAVKRSHSFTHGCLLMRQQQQLHCSVQLQQRIKIKNMMYDEIYRAIKSLSIKLKLWVFFIYCTICFFIKPFGKDSTWILLNVNHTHVDTVEQLSEGMRASLSLDLWSFDLSVKNLKQTLNLINSSETWTWRIVKKKWAEIKLFGIFRHIPKVINFPCQVNKS